MDNKNKRRTVIGNRRPRPSQPSPSSERNLNNLNNRGTSGRSRPRTSSTQRPQVINTRQTQRRESSQRRSVRPAPTPPETPSKDSTAVRSFSRLPWWAKVLIGLLCCIFILFMVVFFYARFTPLNPDLSGNIELYNISPNAAAVASSHRIANIAIFGIDGRADVEGERSDTIMIGTADYEHNRLKVTSLMRDTYVEMAGEDFFDKLNAAYSLGGPEEALKTINLNFDTPITDYIVFNFNALVQMVNAVGGVDITINDEDELYWTNQYLMDVNDKVGTQDPDVPGTGVQHLTGSQALSYARIRYIGNGDYDRTQRQRNVLEQVVAKASAMSPMQQFNLVQSIMPYIQTSLRPTEILKYGLNFVMMSDHSIMQNRLPEDGMVADGYLNGVSYIFPNTLVDNIKAWYQFVYEIEYTPSVTAQEISQEIEDTWY